MTASVAAGSACRVCGGAFRADTAFGARDYVTGDSFTVARCERCGVGATIPLPADLSRYYVPSYRRYSGISGRLLQALFRRQIRKWLGRFDRPGAVLEIGSGTGWMLKTFREAGWSAVGTERDAATADAASRMSGADVIVGDAADLPSRGKFDLIVLFQVLEHLADPLSHLRACAERLRGDGRVIIAVPNLDGWQGRIFGREWFHLDVPRHLHHFSPESLEFVMERAGLRIDRISFVSPEHDPFGWVQSILNEMGFTQNDLALTLMGERRERRPAVRAAMYVSAVIVAPLACVASVLSWAAGRGAIVQVECVAAEGRR